MSTTIPPPQATTVVRVIRARSASGSPPAKKQRIDDHIDVDTASPPIPPAIAPAKDEQQPLKKQPKPQKKKRDKRSLKQRGAKTDIDLHEDEVFALLGQDAVDAAVLAGTENNCDIKLFDTVDLIVIEISSTGACFPISCLSMLTYARCDCV